jgi:hypothetical protein
MKKAILLVFLAASAQAGNETTGGNPGGGHGHHGGFGGGVAGGYGGNGGGGGFGGVPGGGIPVTAPVGTVNNGGTGVSSGGVVAGVARGGIVAGVAPGGTVQGGNGGSIARGAVNNNVSSGTSFNNPRQTPMAYAPPAFSTADCIKSYSAGGSGSSFGFSVGIGTDSAPCNARADAIRWQEMQMAPVACHRMVAGDYEEADLNKAALRASGMNCNQAASFSPAVATSRPVETSTKTLDYLMPPNHKHPEIVQMIDNQHKKEMAK